MTNRGSMFGALAVLIALAGPVAAGERVEIRQIAVPVAGLDLSTPAGIDLLAARIDHGVRRVCGADRRCRDGAWASTEDQVDHLIRKAQAWRRLAEERAAQLRACRSACPRPASWYRPPPPGATTTVIVIRQ